MKIFVWLRIAWRTINWKRQIWPVLISVFGMICISMGWELYRGITEEKSQPCEVAATAASGNITREMLTGIREVEGVLSETLIWELDTALVYEEYQAHITMYGMDGGYLQGEWLQGEIFPESSAMPYLILNEAAVLAFRDEKGVPPTDAASIDWTVKELELADEKRTLVRVRGVIRDGCEDPRVYLSMEQVKALRAENGQESPAERVWLRLKDSGCREAVVQAISGLGLNASFEDAREADWTLRTERQNLFLGVGSILVLCSVILLVFIHLLWKREDAAAFSYLELAGISRKASRGILCLSWGITFVLSYLLGRLILIFIT